MILYVTSGYSLNDYISQNGWRKALRLLFRSPGIVWQMGGSGVMRLLLRSRNVHVLIESKGFVLDRQFCTDVITTGPTVLTRPDIQGYINIGKPSVAVPSKAQPRSSGLFKVTVGYLILYFTKGKSRGLLKADCVSVARWYLERAGVQVPDSIWNVDGLITHLQRLGYEFTSIKKDTTMGAPKIPKQETPKVAAAPPPPAPSAAIMISPITASGSPAGRITRGSMYSTRTSSRGKKALTFPRLPRSM